MLGEKDKKGDDNELVNTAIRLGQQVPFVSQIVSVGMYDSNPMPIFAAVENFISGGAGAITAKSEEAKARAAVDSISGMFTLMGVPMTAQIRGNLKQLIGSGGGGSSGSKSGTRPARPAKPARPARPARPL